MSLWLSILTIIVLSFAAQTQSRIVPNRSDPSLQELQTETELPTLYEYYTAGGIKNGLVANGTQFKLNGKPIRILSGSLHYFRTTQGRWRDLIRKHRAAGLNAIDAYIAWNLHEEQPGQFNFDGDLDLRMFLKMIHEEDMFVVLRPGPYICAEFEYGGLPGWLLKDPQMKIRSIYPAYQKAVQRYLDKILPMITDLQFTRGGPIIMVQVDNEFGNFGDAIAHPEDMTYLKWLHNQLIEHGINELYFTSDTPTIAGRRGNIQGVLMTANFKDNPARELDELHRLQPDRPQFVSEFWSGWFDLWKASRHQVFPVNDYIEHLKTILDRGASLNLYMFFGGTNWGFTNGGNMQSDNFEGGKGAFVTSYDYDAPLSEAGDLTLKWEATRRLYKEYCELMVDCPKVRIPTYQVKNTTKQNYGSLTASQVLPFESLLKSVPHVHKSEVPFPMEKYGQNFGFILYRHKLSQPFKAITLTGMADRAQIFLDGREILVRDWQGINYYQNETISYNSSDAKVLDILVENMGRINFGHADILNIQRKGLLGDVLADGKPLGAWEVYLLDFEKDMIESINQSKEWKPLTSNGDLTTQGPQIYKFELEIKDPNLVRDTFLLAPEPWHKGQVFVNGVNLGRYWKAGPQKTLYLPSTFLKVGNNEILLFELHDQPSTLNSFKIQLIDHPILGKPTNE